MRSLLLSRLQILAPLATFLSATYRDRCQWDSIEVGIMEAQGCHMKDAGMFPYYGNPGIVVEIHNSYRIHINSIMAGPRGLFARDMQTSKLR